MWPISSVPVLSSMSRYFGSPRAPQAWKMYCMADADLAFDAADGLLQRPRKDGVGLLDANRKLQAIVGIKHKVSPCAGGKRERISCQAYES